MEYFMRIIAEKDSAKRWAAWWEDSPGEFAKSGSVLGAVARLLLHSKRHVAASDLVKDEEASQGGHVEMAVLTPALNDG
jgi:hypothetical protein